jgi:hypothetical protein
MGPSFDHGAGSWGQPGRGADHAPLRRDLRPVRAYPCWSVHQRGGSTLSDDSAAETQTSTDSTIEDAVLLFIGGPLDGRVEVRAARHGDPLPTVTHVHLHDGPKVVHRYDLEPLIDGVGIYNLRPPARKPAPDRAD